MPCLCSLPQLWWVSAWGICSLCPASTSRAHTALPPPPPELPAGEGPRQHPTPPCLSLNSAPSTSQADHQQAQRLPLDSYAPTSLQHSPALSPSSAGLNKFTDNPSPEHALSPQPVKPAGGDCRPPRLPRGCHSNGRLPATVPHWRRLSSCHLPRQQQAQQRHPASRRAQAGLQGARATADSCLPALCNPAPGMDMPPKAGGEEPCMAPQQVRKLRQRRQGFSEQGLLLDPRPKRQPGGSYSAHGQSPPSSLWPRLLLPSTGIKLTTPVSFFFKGNFKVEGWG